MEFDRYDVTRVNIKKSTHQILVYISEGSDIDT